MATPEMRLAGGVIFLNLCFLISDFWLPIYDGETLIRHTHTHSRIRTHGRLEGATPAGTDSMTLDAGSVSESVVVAVAIVVDIFVVVVVVVGGDATSLVPWNRELIASLRHQDWQRIECRTSKSSGPFSGSSWGLGDERLDARRRRCMELCP